MMSKKQPNILVVGGSKGIGRALTEQLLESGAFVVSASRTAPSITHNSLLHVGADALSGDLRLPPSLDRLDGVAYLPGTINLKPFHRLTIADFEADFNLNVLGAVKVLQHAFPLLKASGNASVVLFSTVAVAQGMAFHTSVASAKGAVEGLTRSLAAEWAVHNIRVNAIAPSLTDTPLAASLLSTDEKKVVAQKRNPMGKIGRPENLAATALFLLTSADWMTGQVLGVDGGMSSIRPL